jgi:hypothetical protein
VSELDENYSYMGTSVDNASVAAYRRNEKLERISAEALPENSSLIDYATFAQDHPDRLFPLLYKLRPEFQELFIEYYVLHKSQSFLAEVHGQIQTRVWQNLRIIEQALGALIVLGNQPSREKMFGILGKAGMDYTEHGSLANLITLYAKTQNYAAVAEAVGAPVPAIRKIFRPAIERLLANRDLETVAVGSYLRSLTHQASLKQGGLSNRYRARIQRVKSRSFSAPSPDNQPLLEFGRTDTLGNTPWNMFEISSEQRMSVILPVLRAQGQKIFGKKAGQIFAPLDANGELKFCYIFARSTKPSLTRSLTHVRGISEMAASYRDDTSLGKASTVPDADIQKLIESHGVQKVVKVHIGDFVEIITGKASRYCGVVKKIRGTKVRVDVSFPTGRQFVIRADATAVKPIAKRLPEESIAFWGIKL